MINQERFRNQRDLISPERLEQAQFTVVGAGAIGSFLTLSLAKMGATHIKVWDDDTIEEHNIATQFYPASAVGEGKVTALAHMIRAFTGVELETESRNWTPQDSVRGYVISCVDSMAVRRQLFNAAKEAGAIYVDGRMAGEQFRVYNIDTTKAHEVQLYEGSLYTDEQATAGRCTQRSIMYTVLGVVFEMVSVIKKRVNGDYISNNELMYGCAANLMTKRIARAEAIPA